MGLEAVLPGPQNALYVMFVLCDDEVRVDYLLVIYIHYLHNRFFSRKRSMIWL